MRGSIRQRGSTYTSYWDTTDPETGKRVQRSKGGFKTKKAAHAHLNEIMGSVQDGAWNPDRPITVRQLLEDHWLPAQRSRELRPATVEQYRNVVDAWIVPNIGGVRAAALTPAIVNEMTDTLRTATSSTGRQGLSPRSAQLSVGVLKAACVWAVANGLLGRNPIAGINRPRSSSTVMQAWTADQAAAFLQYVKDDRLAWAWSLFLTRGLRRGEVCGLRWTDVDLEAGTVRINRTRVTVNGKPVDSVPKTAAGRRSIPLDPGLVAILQAHSCRQAAEKLAAGAAYQDGGWLLSDELGRPVHPETLSGWFEERVAAAGLPRIRLHDTRHTAASLMLATGQPVKVVSEMLGHSSPTITLSIYAHVLPGMAEAAGAALSALVLGG